MRAFRRAANPIRTLGNHNLVVQQCSPEKYTPNNNLKHADRQRGIDHRNLSMQTGETISSREEDDGFCDLEEPVKSENDGELVSQELIDDGLEEVSAEASGASLGLLNSATDLHVEEGWGRESSTSSLFQVLMEAPRHSVKTALEKWVEEGNSLERNEISFSMLNLRKRQFYDKALQFAEWLVATKRLNFVEHDYSSHLDLVAKVRGLQKAEKYIKKIPHSFRGELVYRTLLANCVSALNVKKAEEVFNEIRDLGLPITAFSCNQLLILYKKVDKKKIPGVLMMMEKENIKSSLLTYRLLIDLKGRSCDIAGMELVVDMMKAEGMEPDILIQAKLAQHYIFGGLIEKAEAILKEMEGDDIKENRGACKALLTLYAALGKADDLERVWKACEANPGVHECLAAMEGWGKVGQVEKAEEILENMIKTRKQLSSKYYDTLLRVYANHKLLSKGNDLLKRMEKDGYRIGPLTLDALVKLYVEGGEVEKAGAILNKATERSKIRPLFSSYLTMLHEYGRSGDVHNAEKIFHNLRQGGYSPGLKPYQLLLEAYSNAKSPAYGFRERMKADNVFPNSELANQLAAVDAFRKSEISELID